MSPPLRQPASRPLRSLLPAALLVLLASWLAWPQPALRAHPPHPVVRDTVRGTNADEVLQGGAGPDLLDGMGGDDRLVGLAGNDVLNGGPGRDVLLGGPGEDILSGGDDADWLIGGDDRDWLFGDGSDDLLEGGPGPDALDGGLGNDRLQGGDGDDMLDGNAGEDLLEGGAGNDKLDGGDGIDLLDGGDGDDNLDGGDDNDVLRGGAGADTLAGADGDDDLDGAGGNDLLLGGDGDDVLRAGPGSDGLAGGDGNDRLDGGADDDLLNGGEGDDVLVGAAGADTLLGHHGSDRLTGGQGNDILQGGNGTDALEGDEGDDRLTGGAGADRVHGGAGNDVILLRAGDVDSAATELIDGGSNSDTTRAEADTLLLSGFSGARIPAAGSGYSGEIEIIDPITGGRYLVSRVERIVFFDLFPYLAGGESLLQLVNTSTEPLQGRIEVYDVAGRPMAATHTGDSAVAVLPLQLPASGSAEIRLHAPADGQIRVYADRVPALALRTALPGGSRHGLIPATRFRDEFSAPLVLDRSAGITTGIAVTTGAVGTTLHVWAVNATGQEIEATNVEVPPRGGVVRFAHDLFPRLERFEGRLAVEAGQTGAVAFQVRAGSTTPAAIQPWSDYQPAGPQRLPYLVSGGGNRFTVVVAAYDSVAGGRVAFFDAAGQPLAVDVSGVGPVTEVPVRFGRAQEGALFITTTGNGPATAATAVVTTERGTVSTTSWVTLGADGVVEIPGSRGLSGFVAPVRLDADGGTTVSVALSAGPSPVTVTLTLVGESGQRLRGGEAQVRLQANGQVVRPLQDLFPRAQLNQFRGSLTVSAAGSRITAAVLERGGGTAALVPLTPTP